MPAFMFLRIGEDFSYKSESMKLNPYTDGHMVRFLSLGTTQQHICKCAQLLRFSISRKTLTLNSCLNMVVTGTLGLALRVLKRLRVIQFAHSENESIEYIVYRIEKPEYSKHYKSLRIRFQRFNFLDLSTKIALQSYSFSIKYFKAKSTVKSCLHNWPQFVNELKTPPV